MWAVVAMLSTMVSTFRLRAFSAAMMSRSVPMIAAPPPSARCHRRRWGLAGGLTLVRVVSVGLASDWPPPEPPVARSGRRSRRCRQWSCRRRFLRSRPAVRRRSRRCRRSRCRRWRCRRCRWKPRRCPRCRRRACHRWDPYVPPFPDPAAAARARGRITLRGTCRRNSAAARSPASHPHAALKYTQKNRSDCRPLAPSADRPTDCPLLLKSCAGSRRIVESIDKPGATQALIAMSKPTPQRCAPP